MSYIGYKLRGANLKDYQNAQTLNNKPLSEFVLTTGDQSIAGVKTFAVSPRIESTGALGLAVGDGTPGAPVEGMMRWHENELQGFSDGAWVSFALKPDLDPIYAQIDQANNLRDQALIENNRWSTFYQNLLSGNLVNVNANLLNGLTGSQFVDTASQQNIAGVKTFTQPPGLVLTQPLKIPVGTTVQRSADVYKGDFRLNSSTDSLEVFNLNTSGVPEWTSLIDSGNFSNTNLLLNTNLRAWNRPNLHGINLSNFLGYIADRWSHWAPNGVTTHFTNIRELTNSSEEDYSGFYNKVVLTNTTTGANIGSHIAQTIPSKTAQDCVGRTFTASFKARLVSGEPTLNFGIAIYRGFGVPAGESKWVFINNCTKTVTLNSEMRKYKHTFTFPINTLNGVTLYPENCLVFYLSLAPLASQGVISTKEVHLADFMVEEAPFASRYVQQQSRSEEDYQLTFYYQRPTSDFVNSLYHEYNGVRVYWVNWFPGSLMRFSSRDVSTINWDFANFYNATYAVLYNSPYSKLITYQASFTGWSTVTVRADGTSFDRDLEAI